MADSRPIVIGPLAGVDQRWPAAAPSANRAIDLWYDPRGGWQSAGGYKRIVRGPLGEGVIVNPFANVGAIESIHYFSQNTGARRWIIYIDGAGNLLQFNPSEAARSTTPYPGDPAHDREGNVITRSVVSTPWIRSQSVTFRNTFYMINGIDQPLAFNGYVWDNAGWQGPASPPSAATMANPHLVDSGAVGDAIKVPNIGLGDTSDIGDEDYKFARRYRVSWINDRGEESPLSEASDVVYFVNLGGLSQSTSAHAAKLLIPTGPPSTVARVLYCTQNLYDSSSIMIVGRDRQFFEHSVIQDNETVVIMDVKPDGNLGDPVDDTLLGAWPSGMRMIASFRDRLYGVAGDGTIRFTPRGHPEVWPPSYRIDVGDAHLGPPTALYATRNALLVGKTRGIYLISDDGVSLPSASTLTRESGFSAHNTVREVPGMGVIGVSDNGLTVLQGTLQNEGVPTSVINAGIPLPDEFASLNTSALLNACSAVYPADKELWISVPTLGSPFNDQVWVYHYEVRQWTTRPYYPIASMLTTPDEAGYLLFGSYAATTGVSPDGLTHLGIFVYSRGCDDKDGTPITPLYETNQISVASQFRAFRPLHVMVDCILHGDNPLSMNLHVNHSLTAWLTDPAYVKQQYPQEPVPVYGTAVFDTSDRWQTWRPGSIRLDIEAPSLAPILETTITLAPKSGTRYMTLMSLDLEIAPDDPVQAKPLKPDGA